jgi:hypothetical protein
MELGLDVRTDSLKQNNAAVYVCYLGNELQQMPLMFQGYDAEMIQRDSCRCCLHSWWYALPRD